MEKIKNRLALLGILAVIGIGTILAAYFTGISSNKEEASNQMEGADKGIAIILKPAQEKEEKEINASAAEETDEIKAKAKEATGAAGIKEEKPAPLLREFAGAKSTGGGGNESEYMENQSVAESATVPSPPLIPPPSAPSEGLQQNITSSLNVVVLNEGEVISNETVDLENE